MCSKGGIFIIKNGILVIDKPYGCTSFDVIFNLRRMLKVKKAGHCGTLDPIATGVLPVFFGKATKAINFLPDTNKEYIAGFKLGFNTDTLDITGKVLNRKNSYIKKEDIISIIPNFKGRLKQLPPMYSAVKVNGEKLYNLARQGKVVNRKERIINVYNLELLQFNENSQEGFFFVYCSSGTYIRSLIDDICKALGVFGTLSSLRRSFSCGFYLKDAVKLEYIKYIVDLNYIDRLCSLILPIESVFKGFSRLNINISQRDKFLNGVKLSLGGACSVKGIVSIYCDNEFLGLAHYENGFLKIDKLFK